MSTEKEMFAMQQSVSLSVEIPEELHLSVQQYLDVHPGWSQDRLFCAAVSLFLMQNGVTKRQVSRIYLDSLFGQQNESQQNKRQPSEKQQSQKSQVESSVAAIHFN